MEDSSAPATKADLAELRAELRAELNSSSERVIETMRDIETHMLTEFHRYAKGTSQRLHTHEVGIHALDERMHLIEERVLELESRIRPKH